MLIVIEIWERCIQHYVWLITAHIHGSVNIIAYQESRKFSSDLEWALDVNIYKEAVKLRDFTPSTDLYASRLNEKCQQYISYHLDPGAQAVNTFTISWRGLYFYAFPPFSIILRTLCKIRGESHRGYIVPHWPTQTWLLYLSSILSRTMHLLFCKASENYSKVEIFQTQLQTSFSFRHPSVTCTKSRSFPAVS